MQKPVITDDTIVIPSSQNYLADVDAFIESQLRSYGASDSVIADIAISVSELVNNAIIHGNRSAPNKCVKVRIGRSNSTVSIAVTDQGPGFNPDRIQNPIEDDNLMKEVGRGIFIVRALMDSVDIDATDEGTTIKITKAI